MTERPLYHSTSIPSPQGHAGLWYDKFCAWKVPQRDWTEAEVEKVAWIRQVARAVGDRDLLGEHIARRKRLLNALGGRLLRVTTVERLVTGLGYRHPVENGFAWHPVLGTPYLPGSGLKGVARAWARLLEIDSTEIERIFGPRGEGKEPQAGRVIFLDAIPDVPIKLVGDVITPHYGPYYSRGEAPGDYLDPNPIPFLVVEKGATFLAGILPRDQQDQEDADLAQTWLREALEQLGAGAKTANGYGRLVTEPT